MAKVEKSYWAEYRKRKSQDLLWKQKESKRVQAYYAKHPDKKKESWAKFSSKRGIERRPVERLRHALKVLEQGREYAPRPFMRKPDWMPVGKKIADVESQFLINNQTKSQVAFAKETDSK